MYMTIVFITLLIYCTSYLILSAILHVPTIKQSIIIRKTGIKKDKINVITLVSDSLVHILSKCIFVSPVTDMRLSKALKSVDIDISVKQYLAKPLSYVVMLIPLIILSYFVSPFICIIISIIAVAVYMEEYNKVNRLQKKKKALIEGELLQFVSLISHSIKYDRNILSTLEKFKENTNSYFYEELTITVTDMRTGNYERALKNLEVRVGSIYLSEVVRGLISANSGHDTAHYFENLTNKFKELEKQRLQEIIHKKIPKINRMSMFVFIGILLLVFTILAQFMNEQLVTVFN